MGESQLKHCVHLGQETESRQSDTGRKELKAKPPLEVTVPSLTKPWLTAKQISPLTGTPGGMAESASLFEGHCAYSMNLSTINVVTQRCLGMDTLSLYHFSACWFSFAAMEKSEWSCLVVAQSVNQLLLDFLVACGRMVVFETFSIGLTAAPVQLPKDSEVK